MTANGSKGKCKIDGVETTSDIITSRAGLILFVKYLENITIYPHIERLFGGIRKSRKGQPIGEMFKQVFCFLMDGTSRHLAHFDVLKADPGYAATIESSPQELLSTAAIKRFFNAFSWYRIWLFRGLLQQLFLWRLGLEKPDVIELGIDTMVMNNDEAKRRQGVSPTYKKVKGFQPLQVTWQRFIIDAVFRGGSKHSNHGDTVQKTLTHLVNKIRKRFGKQVPILVRMDSGFFDQKLFELFESLEIGYIVTGKLYDDIKAFVCAADKTRWDTFIKSKRIAWKYLDFGSRRSSWSRFRRAIYCLPVEPDGQLVIGLQRPESVLYTNLGMGSRVDDIFEKAGLKNYCEAQWIIAASHSRGADELVHRALKDFSSETMPFQKFSCNAALYYMMLLAFFLYEAYKQDVCSPVIPIESYPTTFRRKLIDIAGKVVRTGGKIILKIAQATREHLQFDTLWQMAMNAPPFSWG